MTYYPLSKRFNIGFDVDGVLVDILPALNNYHNETYGTSFQREDYMFFDLSKVWGGAYEEAIEKVERFYASPYFTDIKPFPGAIEGVKELHKYHDLFVITSRWGLAKEETKRWINAYFPNQFAGIHFSHNKGTIMAQGKKSALCRELELDIFVEDHLDYARECVFGKNKVILFDMPWNQSSSLPRGIFRVHSWEELLKRIKDLAC